MFERRYSATDAISLFFEAIEPFEGAYPTPSFSYLAAFRQGAWRLVRARLFLHPLERPIQSRAFKTHNLAAGHYSLSESGQTAREFLNALARGVLDTPHGVFLFDHPQQPNALVAPLHAEGLVNQGRVVALSLLGDEQISYFSQPETDWELKASTPPFHDLNDVTAEFSTGTVTERGALVEVFAGQIAVVDYNSPVSGTIAKPTIKMNRFLDPKNLLVGIRIMHGDNRPRREVISGSSFNWSDDLQLPDAMHGTIDLEVPDGSLISCYISYKGTAVHYGWIKDDAANPNALRAVIENFDPRLESTQSLLTSSGRNPQKNDLDDGVATTLWLLGFAPTQIGRNALTSDAVDIVARTPKGHYLLVECTTGILKAQNKLANLLQRTAQVRRSIANSWASNARVVPIMVTQLPRLRTH